MDKYYNKNMACAIEEFKICQGVAKDSGRTYDYALIVFNNGFEKRFYLNDGEKFAVLNSFEVVELTDNFDK